MSQSQHTLVLATTFGEVADPKTWSATPKRIQEHLGPFFRSCQTFNYAPTSLPRFAERVTFRLFNWNKCSRNKYYNRSYERRFLEQWERLDPVSDLCLHLSDYCVPAGLKGKARHFVYADSTLTGAARYIPRGVSPSFLTGYRKLSRRYLDSVETVFTLNEWTRQSFIEHHGVPHDHVVNVAFGINLEPSASEKDWNQNLLLIVLRPGSELAKGLTLLLEAFPMVRREIPDAQLAVVGTRVEGAPEGVTFYFNQPRSKTIELMRAATLFTMPAIYELNGIVYLEALASRTPILGLDRFAFPEFSGHGRYGFIVKEAGARDVAGAIIGALKDKKALQRMGTEGQQFAAQRYSWSGTAEQMFRVMEPEMFYQKPVENQPPAKGPA
jgi:glycosyltransferase involved in cell wall biosynthesis